MSRTFRTGRSAHQMLEAVRNQIMSIGGGYVLEVDMRKFFDTAKKRFFLKAKTASVARYPTNAQTHHSIPYTHPLNL